MGFGYATLTYDPEEIVRNGIGDLAACGYDGVEIGLPKIQEICRDRLEATLDEYGMELYCVMAGWLNEHTDVQDAVDGLEIAAAFDVDFLGILPPPRCVVDDSIFGEWLDEIGTAASDRGVTPVVHHHAGSHIEQPAEIRRWLDDGPSELKLLLDTGHYYAYGDVCDGIERFADDTVYVHYKDISPPSNFDTHVTNLSAGKVDYDSIMTYFGAFTDLGKGVLDFAAISRALDAVNYDGNRTVEVDTVQGPTLAHAKRNLDFLREAVGDGDGYES